MAEMDEILEDDDEQTPDFEDLLAAYDLSDSTVVTADSAGDVSVIGAAGSSLSAAASLISLAGTSASSAASSLSILKEMARMEPPITDGNISIRTESSEIVVKENGVVDFRKPYAPKPVSGGKPANMQRIILDMAQQDRARSGKTATNARKTTSSRSLLTSNINGPLRSLETITASVKAKKTISHLGPPSRIPAFSGQQSRIGLSSPTIKNNVLEPTTSIALPSKSISISSSSKIKFDESHWNGKNQENGYVDDVEEPLADEAESSSQLYTSVLPPYVPVRSSDQDNLTVAASQDDGGFGFPCFDCSDRFLVEPSLMAHLERRSVHITFTCNACKKDIVFHNRCSLLSHVRAHRERNQPSDLCNIRVRPLETSEFVSEAVLTVKDSAINGVTNNDSIGGSDGVGPNINNHSSKYHQCPECKQYCGSSLSLQEHFGHSRSRAVRAVKCSRCRALCPTKCSLSAHSRTHDKKRPFLCPECGTLFTDSWEVFQRHLTTVCMHSSRTTGYKCPAQSCDALYYTASELIEHVMDGHGDSLHKCQGCPMAFRTLDGFDSHRLEQHSSGEDVSVQCRAVSKCPMCDVVFQNAAAFRSHVQSTHADSLERDLRFLYRCNVCKLILDDKTILIRHLKRNHPSVFKMRCKICRSAFREVDLLVDHMRRKHPEQTEALKEIETQSESSQMEVDEDRTSEGGGSRNPSPNTSEMMIVTMDGEDVPQSNNGNNRNNSKKVECRQCRRSFHSKLGLKMHLLRSHTADDKRAWCAVCSEYLPDQKEMAKHGHTVHVSLGQLVCTLCNNIVFGTKFGLAKHLDQHADGLSYPLDCVYCDKRLGDPKAAANHWKSEHKLFSFACDLCDAQYLQENSFLRHKRCAHGEGDANKKYYRCSMCEDVDFAKRSNLVHHLETKHGIPKMDIDLSQLVSTQCSPAKQSLLQAPLTSTPTPGSTTPPPPPNQSSAKKKKKRKRRKESKRDRKKKRNRSSKSKKPSSTSATFIDDVGETSDKIDENEEEIEEENDEENEEETSQPPKKKQKSEIEIEKAVENADGGGGVGGDDDDDESVEHHVCAKCEYEATKRSDFVDHIRCHKRIGENNYQCLECGISFVVEPSLRKHLAYAHKVKDVDAFMAEKGYPTYVTTCNGTGDGNGAVLESPVKEQYRPSSSSSSIFAEQRIFQCDVCRNNFDTELALRTHMRTHGMAFLKIKRVTNVTVSPQKQ